MELSDILSLLMLLTTIVSVYCAFQAYHHQKERTRKEAACNLARVYSDEILDKCSIVKVVLDQSGILEFVKENFTMEDIKNFTQREVFDFATRNGIKFEDLRKKMNTFDHFSILNAVTCKTNSMVERNALNVAFREIADGHTAVPKNEKFLKLYFADTISSLLNTLEWFSMNCRYGLADEKVLYQSLHQTFLSTVWMMYYYISMNNAANVDKYYTNIIWLFTEWKTRLKEETDRYVEDMAAAEAGLRAAKEQAANAGRVYEGKSL